MTTTANPLIRFSRRVITRAASFLGMPLDQYNAISSRSVGSSLAGVSVNSDSALKVAAYKRGVELIGNYIGKTPFHIRRDNKKDKTHPAWKIVRKWAQYHQLSAFEFRRTMIVLAQTRGNAFAYIVRDPGTYEPLELRILDPGRVRVVLKRGQLGYTFGESPRVISATDVIHIRALSTDGYCGLDPIRSYAADVLGLSLAQSQYASTYYAAGGAPSVYLYSATPLDDDKFNRLKGETGPLKRSLENPHEIPVLDMAELKSLNLSAEQTQLLGSREFALKDIANILNITVHKLNGEGTGGYKSVEEENNAFRDDTLDPWFVQFEIEYEKLLTEAEQAAESHTVEAVRESLTRSNMADRANYLQKAIGGPWMSAAEGRDVDSLESLPNTGELYPPPNMTKADPNAATADTTPARAVNVLKQVAAVEDTFARMVKRLTVQARKAGERSAAFPEFLNDLPTRHGDVIRSALRPVVEVCGGDGEHVERLARALLAETRVRLQTVYDTATPDNFSAEVGEACDTLERSVGQLARKAVESWTLN